MKIYDVLIIGGGAAGLAAASCGHPGWILAEKNDQLCRKIYATGNGRCNYMNMNAGEAALALGAEGLRSHLGDLGILGREEEAGRVYPMSGKAEDVALALISTVNRSGTEVVTGFEAVSAVKDGDAFLVSARDGRTIRAEKLIIAAGGKAGIQYGSDGVGMKMAAALGHKVIKPIPALTYFTCAEDISSVVGVRVSGRVSVVRDKDGMSVPLASDHGEIQFAKNGLSGICVMNLSRCYRLEEGASFYLLMDLMEEYSLESLQGLFSARREAFPGENAYFILNTILPRKLAGFVLTGAGIDGNTPAAELSDRQLLILAAGCKLLRFSITGAGGWKDAQVTCGGVDLAEVDMETMESKLVPGLYFAGEVLNYDGPCGGYNLTWAFSTGLTAGKQANDKNS